MTRRIQNPGALRTRPQARPMTSSAWLNSTTPEQFAGAISPTVRAQQIARAQAARPPRPPLRTTPRTPTRIPPIATTSTQPQPQGTEPPMNRLELQTLMSARPDTVVTFNGQRMTVQQVIRLALQGDDSAVVHQPPQPVNTPALQPSRGAVDQLTERQREAILAGEGIEGLTRPVAPRVRATSIPNSGVTVTHMTNSQDGSVAPSADPLRINAKPVEQNMRVRQVTRD